MKSNCRQIDECTLLFSAKHPAVFSESFRFETEQFSSQIPKWRRQFQRSSVSTVPVHSRTKSGGLRRLSLRLLFQSLAAAGVDAIWRSAGARGEGQQISTCCALEKSGKNFSPMVYPPADCLASARCLASHGLTNVFVRSMDFEKSYRLIFVKYFSCSLFANDARSTNEFSLQDPI